MASLGDPENECNKPLGVSVKCQVMFLNYENQTKNELHFAVLSVSITQTQIVCVYVCVGVYVCIYF